MAGAEGRTGPALADSPLQPPPSASVTYRVKGLTFAVGGRITPAVSPREQGRGLTAGAPERTTAHIATDEQGPRATTSPGGPCSWEQLELPFGEYADHAGGVCGDLCVSLACNPIAEAELSAQTMRRALPRRRPGGRRAYSYGDSGENL